MSEFASFLTEPRAVAMTRQILAEHEAARTLAEVQAKAEYLTKYPDTPADADHADMHAPFTQGDQERLKRLAALMTGPYQVAVCQVVAEVMPALFEPEGQA